jgi:3-oxoacyl-[acyl-carrier-protein] synthase II
MPAEQLYEAIRTCKDASLAFRRIPIPHDLDVGMDDELLATVLGPEPTSIPGLRRPFPDRPTLMAIVAVDEAIARARLDTRAGSNDSIGLVLNTCFGPSQTVERFLRVLVEQGPAQVSAISFSRAVSNAVVGEISRRHNLRGPSTAVLGCSALAYGIDLLVAARAEVIICVGVDEVRDLHLWAYRRAGLLSGGMKLGEGAAALVLERADTARARGAPIIARVAGHSTSFCADSVHRITKVNARSLAWSMEEALRNSGRSAADVSWIVAVDNGDLLMAESERLAAQCVLRDDLQWIRPKRILGESFGASEGLATIIGSSALNSNRTHTPEKSLCMISTCHVGGAVSSILLESLPCPGIGESH